MVIYPFVTFKVSHLTCLSVFSKKLFSSPRSLGKVGSLKFKIFYRRVLGKHGHFKDIKSYPRSSNMKKIRYLDKKNNFF